MAEHEPLRAFADAFADIPDPAAQVASQPAPEPVMPTAPSPTRAERRRRTVIALVLALSWVGVCIWHWKPRADIGDASVTLPVAFWLLSSAVALFISVHPRPRGLPPGIRAIQIVLAAVPLLFVIPVLFLSASPPDGSLGLRWEGGGSCTSTSSLIGMGPLLLASFALEGSFSSIPAARGAVMGAVAGLFGAIGVHTICAAQGRGHMLFAHGAPILLLAAVGALIGVLRGRP